MDGYRLVMRHFGWKVTSVFIATLLWIAIWWDMIEKRGDSAQDQGPLGTRVYEDIPIIVLKRASDTNRFVLEPSAASVKLKANSALLEKTLVSDLRVSANLIDVPRTNQFLVPLELDVPARLEVEFLKPRATEVRIIENQNFAEQ
ncbi:MAG: hypothetical protein M2R45_01646 [Verrucomicrobia subdivision 3 bacterium]|nr:hypothetical protein [Limisphaerales bacterium]MCS1412797.1 hypothetical protein [Limisphaerales bacterium]